MRLSESISSSVNVKECDILIAGAGPGGCSTALNLSDDLKVLLIDSSHFPRNKICGGVLIEKSWNFLKNTGFDPPKNVFAEPKDLPMKIIDIENDFQIDIKRGYLNVRRRNFDKWLLELCREKSEFLQLSRLEKVAKLKDGFLSVVKTPSKRVKIKSRYLIDSTGAQSFSKTSMGIKKPIYIAYQEWIKGQRQDYFSSIYCSKVTDYYIWVIPKDGYTLVGTAFGPFKIREKIQNFRKFLKRDLGIKKKPERFEAGILLRPGKEDILLTHDGAMLVGESAGLINPNTGEGIGFALKSGMFCAESIKNNPQNPEKEYTKLCRELSKEIEDKAKVSADYNYPIKRIRILKKISK